MKGYAGRETLGSGRRRKKEIDMPYVYGQIDGGRTAGEVASELDVSVKTLQRRHKEYQESLKTVEKKE